jgi:hypothetical protein
MSTRGSPRPGGGRERSGGQGGSRQSPGAGGSPQQRARQEEALAQRRAELGNVTGELRRYDGWLASYSAEDPQHQSVADYRARLAARHDSLAEEIAARERALGIVAARPAAPSRAEARRQAQEAEAAARAARVARQQARAERSDREIAEQEQRRAHLEATRMAAGRPPSVSRRAAAQAAKPARQQAREAKQPKPLSQEQRQARLRATVAGVERRMIEDTATGDYARVIRTDGKVLGGTGKRVISFDDQVQRQMQGTIVSIRHYGGTPPHEREIAFAAARQVAQLRIVTRNARYVLSPGPRGWDADRWRTEIRPAIVRAARELGRGESETARLAALRGAQQGRQQDAAARAIEHEEQLLQRVAEYAGLRYRKIPVGEAAGAGE